MWKPFTFLFASASCLCAQSETQILSRVLQQYSKVHAESPVRGPIESIYFRGIQIQEGRSLPVTIHRKRPNSIRYQLGEGSGAVVLGYDGTLAWRQTRSGGESQVERLDEAASALLRAEADFTSPLLDDLYNPNQTIELEGTEHLADELVYRLLVDDRRGRQNRYYVSAVDYHVLKKEELDDSGQVVMETRYRDYRIVDGYPFAQEVENRLEGKTVALTRFEEIKVNSGLLSFYFEMPDD